MAVGKLFGKNELFYEGIGMFSMEIEILGSGCPKCKKLAELAEQAAKEQGILTEIYKITDVNEIISRGIISAPALLIGREIKCAGKIPDIEEIKNWLKK